jgi:hypothetical protein
MLGENLLPQSTYIAIGLLVGLAALIRPIAIACGSPADRAVVCYPDWPRQQRLALRLFLLLGNILAVVPREFWAWRQTGSFIPFSTGGLPGVLDGLTIMGPPELFPRVPAGVSNLMQDLERRRLELTSLGRVAGYLVQESDERPAAVLTLLALKGVRVWNATET